MPEETIASGSKLYRLDLPYNACRPRGSHLETFNAEAKRSWFSVKQSLKGISSKGRLWLRARVAVLDNQVSVSTAESEESFRPHRLVWKDENSFVLLGLGKGSKSKRGYLKLTNPGLAIEAASIIKNRLAIIEEPLTRVEELQVLVKFLFSTREITLQLFSFLARLIVAVIVFTIASSFGTLGELAAIGYATFYFGFPFWAFLRRRGKKVPGWLRFVQGSLLLRTTAQFRRIIPRELEWTEPETFVIIGRGNKLELSFSTRSEAAGVAEKIKSVFPAVREIPVRWEDMLGLNKPRL